jgi:hypothetical protein
MMLFQQHLIIEPKYLPIDLLGLTDQFFVSFDPATGANVDAFDVDNRVALSRQCIYKN